MNQEIVILVVDDNLENLRVVSNFLKSQNYKIALASSGKEALQILESTNVDLILLDVMMPEMDGYEVCGIIKSNPKLKDIPIIFLTALTDTEDIVKGFKVGGVDYVTKPFRNEELFARVNNQIQLKQVRDRLIECELSTRNSRDYFMRTLYDIGKIIGPKS